ncbi:uncharacterized protein LOC62_04G005468 [Vanrija pseudolonga]|uniref:DUF4604 domain-containing protein n=1 Tax=Vanrija pseudolonga TaxID=143232 RepID=A0AAF1BI70_9TREE|nr:hypothetical protein LOC62_04G005468 [Vanrija pseudolonga]
MSQHSRAQLNKLEYVAQKPAFLANFGAPPKAEGRRDARDLPSRPKDGEWAAGSDDEGDEEEDEWEAQFGGGDDGPQIVVLKEGRHLSKEEVEKARGKGDAPGKSSGDALDNLKQLVGESTAKAQGKEVPAAPAAAGGKSKAARPTPAGAKRKLVGEAVASAAESGDKKAKNKKKKVVKGLLSFDEAEGEA